MAEVEELLAEFRDAYLAGEEADVTLYLRRAPAARRQELARAIDSFLMGVRTRRPWNADAYRGSLAQAAVDRVYEASEGVSGAWPELLPRLRTRARIKRSELVERLAAALGFDQPEEIERIAAYYHRMEHGTLPAQGVSDRVIEALSAIVGAAAETIRGAGMAGSPHEGAAEPAFARTASPGDELADAMEVADAGDPVQRDGERDAIDTLFLDG